MFAESEISSPVEGTSLMSVYFYINNDGEYFWFIVDFLYRMFR